MTTEDRLDYMEEGGLSQIPFPSQKVPLKSIHVIQNKPAACVVAQLS